jgi:hypothetical protein
MHIIIKSISGSPLVYDDRAADRKGYMPRKNTIRKMTPYMISEKSMLKSFLGGCPLSKLLRALIGGKYKAACRARYLNHYQPRNCMADIIKRDRYPETPVESDADKYRPSEEGQYAGSQYMRARKDFVLGNITDFDLALASIWNNTADSAHDMGMPQLAEMHAEQLTFYYNFKRSVGGFERREQGKTKTEVSGAVNYQGKAPTQVIVP